MSVQLNNNKAVIKLHRNLVLAVATTLQQIFVGNTPADKAIEQVLKSNSRWGARDRAFIAETTYETVRWYRLLCHLGQKQPPTTPEQWLPIIGIVLLLKYETETSAAAFRLPDDWPEFAGLHPEKIYAAKHILLNTTTERALAASIPDWLDEIGYNELGDQWQPVLNALNQPAPVVLRTNTLRITRENLRQALHTEGVETQIFGNDAALIVTQRQNLFKTNAFLQGWFEVQDAASQLVAPALQVKPHLRVVDACAGAGGKTLHLAALMQNKGQIIALDTDAHKLQTLQQRARRAGAFCIETRPIAHSKIIKRLYATADRLLLDVPCSGQGVLRRNPDTKWKLNPARLTELKQIQQQILRQYSPICKPGGLLVYATCSILPSENEAQIEQFLSEQTTTPFTLLSSQHLWPQTYGFDGFYIAVLQRTA